ncbi:ornithine cyclodeaminase family protein [Cardiobacteriaceae bacterium TAE3-ERU3]|nr:ornithine cyclodeaminase family protein [Cardiobacteriaceae bacterium TAE3-ERU3]
MKFFDAEQTAAALTYPELIDALRRYFSTDIEAPLRHVHTMPNKDEHDPMLLLKPAWAKDGEFGGTKLLTFTPDNGQRNLPAIDGAYVLFSREDGRLLALMDAKPMTAKRTAAASALAADYLARKDAKVHLVIGSGAVGSELPHAHRAVRDIERTLIWSRDEQGAKKLVEKLNQQGLKAEHCADLEAGVREADIISSATPSSEPLIFGKWLQPGQHVDLIGSFREDMREADNEAVSRAEVFIDCDAAPEESGDLIQPIKSGVLKEDDIRGDLVALCAGKAKRESNDAITLFKSVGTALEDLAAAEVVYKHYS